MKMQRYMKAAAPIRTLLVASLLFMGFIYGMMGWIGSFAAVNHIPVANAITAQYRIISQNSSYPNSGVFASQKLNTSIKAVTSGLSNPLNIFATAGALGAMGNILLSIPATVQGFLSLIGSPFLAVGVPVTYLWLLGGVIIVGLISLGLLSALFIFNI